MAAINELINQIQDSALRERVQKEVDKLSKQKKFGLVFEEHLPESTPLYEMPIKTGCNVMLRDSKEDKSVYIVLTIDNDKAVCIKRDSEEDPAIFPIRDIVRIAEFGEPIYPYLKPLDTVCNAPDSDLWHALIEADNYHALQLLEYLYAGRVDCIYIDPPYNTGAKDWKYNNDYVDGNDVYRHSKWLSMMQKRLKLAKKLLNPKDSVLIITIDEKEYLHLGCLLEEMFPEAKIQMITSVINVKGSMRREFFSRAEEYIFFVMFGSANPADSVTDMLMNDERFMQPTEITEKKLITWQGLRRRGERGNSFRKSSPGCFYPVFITKDTGKIHSVGHPLPLEVDKTTVVPPEGTWAGWPVRPDGLDGNWQINRERFLEQLKDGTLYLGECNEQTGECSIKYLKSGDLAKIATGELKVVGYGTHNEVLVEAASAEIRNTRPKTVWFQRSHDAGNYGTTIINAILGGGKFSFPKSLYAVHDSIRFFVANKPNAIIVDFFAGSGTTMHAVNLLNAEDGGHRQCIMVTNNEVSGDEARILIEQGHRPGDDAWNALGIARYVTWPRTVCSIEGHDINGQPLKGNYLGSDIPLAAGFKTNAAFFQLSFLDKTAVALGMAFNEMLPILWLKAGASGPCPTVAGTYVPDMLILPENKFAVLVNENAFSQFAEELEEHTEIQTVFLATDYDVNYRAMVKNLNVQTTYQLYRDYLDHFRLNRGRN